MPTLTFSKIIPGGNATILLHEPVIPVGELGRIAGRLMHPMHIQAEQVGALYVAGRPVPFLEMMGGEFCVNATRAAALVLAGMGLMTPVLVPHASSCLLARRAGNEEAANPEQSHAPLALSAEILVSGMPDPVRVLACDDAGTLALCLGRHPERSGTRGTSGLPDGAKETPITAHPGGGDWWECLPSSLYCAARVDCTLAGVSCREIQDGVCLAHMPGMVHVLVDARKHPLPDMDETIWKKAAAAWRAACGIAHAPASGVVWHEKRGEKHRIWPAVEVRASGSEHMETACGSASLALALLERARASAGSGITASGSFSALDIIQPSGESLLVFLDFSCGKDAGKDGEKDAGEYPFSAWIAGPVRLAAHGRAYV